jgi:hypothetical protein
MMTDTPYAELKSLLLERQLASVFTTIEGWPNAVLDRTELDPNFVAGVDWACIHLPQAIRAALKETHHD